MPNASAWDSSVQKQSQFTNTQQSQIWAQSVLKSLADPTVYVLPRYATKTVSFSPNQGRGDFYIPIFKPIANNAPKEYAFDTTTVQDPEPTQSQAIAMNIKRYGYFILGTDTMKAWDSYYSDWHSFYKMEFARVMAAHLEGLFKDELLTGGNKAASGVGSTATPASRYYSLQNNGTTPGTTAANGVKNANLVDLLAIRDKMRNHVIESTRSGQNVPAKITGFRNAAGNYTVVHSQEFFDHISQKDATFRDLITKNISSGEYRANNFIGSYFGLDFEKLPIRWQTSITVGGTAYARDVAMIIGGSRGKEAIAKVSFAHADSYDFFDVVPPRTTENVFKFIRVMMGLMYYAGFKVIRPNSVYLYIYNPASAT